MKSRLMPTLAGTRSVSTPARVSATVSSLSASMRFHRAPSQASHCSLAGANKALGGRAHVTIAPAEEPATA